MKISLKNQAKTALAYFLLAALLGVLLRMFRWHPFPINYKYLVHTHSHIALLGWIYVALMTVLYTCFLHKTAPPRRYRIIFWGTQLTLIGMLLSFPFQGYALYSILFSTLFLLMSYAFARFFFKHVPREMKLSKSYRLVRASLVYMILSSLGPWSLGAIVNISGPASGWYRNAIYYYLHFQYNGWMPMALLGIFFYTVEQRHIAVPETWFRIFYRSLNAGIICSFALSLLWMKPDVYVYVLGGLGASLQCFAFVLLSLFFFGKRIKFKKMFTPMGWRLLTIIGFLILMKVLLQWLVSFPYFANLAASILDFTIAYLHWTFLGVISLGLFVFLDHYNLLRIPLKAISLYLLGFLLTEGLIIYKGIAGWTGFGLFEGYSGILALVSLFIPIALTGFMFQRDGTK